MFLPESIKRRIRIFLDRRHVSKQCRLFRKDVVHKGGEVGKCLCMNGACFIEVGKRVHISDGFRIGCYPVFAGRCHNPHLELGDNVTIEYGFTALVADSLTIGSDTILASNVTIVTENHGIDPESPLPYQSQPLNTAPVCIGRGCWIGQNVTVLPGTSIGDKCVIGANAVVRGTIPPYSIAVGIPAKVIKKLGCKV